MKKYILLITVFLISMNIAVSQNLFPPAGSVGIGTIDPNAPLHIKGSGNASHFSIETNATGHGDLQWFQGGTGTNNQRAALQVDEGNGDFEGWVYDNSNWLQWLRTERTSGKVGIGSPDIESTLTVSSANHTPGLVISPRTNGTLDLYIELHGQTVITNEGFRISYDNNVGDTYFNNIYQHSTHAFHFQSSGNELMTLSSNGNVGIGTAVTGTHKLAVEGSIGARAVKVGVGSWSDFVFNIDYNLQSLEEVENYIAEHKHLPGIPSETEVIKNGINLGEMDSKLLQKIEELTLYTIQQQKLLETQTEQLAKQQKCIEKLLKRIETIENR